MSSVSTRSGLALTRASGKKRLACVVVAFGLVVLGSLESFGSVARGDGGEPLLVYATKAADWLPSQLILARADGSTLRVLTKDGIRTDFAKYGLPHLTYADTDPALAPNHRYVAFYRAPYEVCPPPPSTFHCPPEQNWRSKGTHAGIRILDLRTGRIWAVTDQGPLLEAFEGMRWSPDSRSLLVDGIESLGCPKVTPIPDDTEVPQSELPRATAAKDSKSALCYQGVFAVSLDGRHVKPITREGDDSNPVPSANGTHLAFETGTGIDVLTLASGHLIEAVIPPKPLELRGFDWSRDGRFLFSADKPLFIPHVVSTNEPAGLWLADRAGSRPHRIARGCWSQPRFFPDGSIVAIKCQGDVGEVTSPKVVRLQLRAGLVTSEHVLLNPSRAGAVSGFDVEP